MKPYFWSICFCSALFGSNVGTVHAAYTANYSAPVTGVWVYDGGLVAVQLSSMPTTGCPSNDFFVIPTPPDLTDLAYKAMYARVLSAYALKETINIGYDSGAACVSTRPRIHRIGN